MKYTLEASRCALPGSRDRRHRLCRNVCRASEALLTPEVAVDLTPDVSDADPRTCDRDGPERPIHSHWGTAPEPIASGRKVADCELDQIFARNDNGKYDAPAPAERRAKDDIVELHLILRCHLSDLPRMQRRVILETLVEGHKRAEIAQRLGISVNTDDNHRQAAFRSLRQL